MTRKLMHFILAMIVAGTVAAQDVSIREDHPEEYVVAPGDTLWDIAGRFLDQPWQWPAIWYVNPQVGNPHLIYPGDVLSLQYIDGRPRLVKNGTRVLSPEIVRSDQAAIPPIPLEDIESFLRNVWVAGEAEYDAMGYVIENHETRISAIEGVNTYVRGLDVPVGGDVVILRAENVFWDDTGRNDEFRKVKRVNPRRWGEDAPTRNDPPFYGGSIIGYEMWEVARGRVVKQGDPAIVRIMSGNRAVWEADRVVPAREVVYPAMFQPRALEPMPGGLQVLSVVNNRNSVGHLQVVTVNAGSRQGVQPGHVFSAFRPGDPRFHDEVKYPRGAWRQYKDEATVKLPDEFDGHIMVFRAFDDISFALVMGGRRDVKEFDVLKHPSEIY